jgi:hypothetical protein
VPLEEIHYFKMVIQPEENLTTQRVIDTTAGRQAPVRQLVETNPRTWMNPLCDYVAFKDFTQSPLGPPTPYG